MRELEPHYETATDDQLWVLANHGRREEVRKLAAQEIEVRARERAELAERRK